MRFGNVSLWRAMMVIFTVGLLVLTGCDDDEGPKPTTATLKGTITFENFDLWETWQDKFPSLKLVEIPCPADI